MAKKKESKQKKINVRVDFTPMVDMLMLLITFFMLCTTLSKPSSMQISMPADEQNQNEKDQKEAKQSATVMLYLAADNKIYHGEGIPKYSDPNWIKETTWGDTGLRDVLRNHITEERVKPVVEMELAVKELLAEQKANPKKITDAVCAATGFKNRGVQETDSMSGINWCKIPVSIVEMGFMSNPEEDQKMARDDYQELIAGGIANGIDAYYQ